MSAACACPVNPVPDAQSALKWSWHRRHIRPGRALSSSVCVNTEAPCKFISITAKLSCTYLFASHWVCQSMSTSTTHWKDTHCCLLCLSPYFWHSILVPKPARHIWTCVPRVIRTTVLLPCSSYCSPAKQSPALKMVPVLPMHQSDKVTYYLGNTWLWSLIHNRSLTFQSAKMIRQI